MSHSFILLIVSRILGGFSAGMVMPGVTGMIADISIAKDKAKNFGYMSAIINSGFILGPGIGGFLAEVSHRLPILFCRCIRYYCVCYICNIDSPTAKYSEKSSYSL